MNYDTADMMAASDRVERLIRGLDEESIPLSSLGRHQLTNLKPQINLALKNYRHILDSVRRRARRDLSDLVLVDYGGGLGVMTLLARQLGVATVIYNDIYESSLRDAQSMANAVGLPAHHYVCGDIGNLVKFTQELPISCDAIVSYDVLEHIYDLTQYFLQVRLITRDILTLVMGTGANTHNPWIRRAETRKHLDSEYKDLPKKWGEGMRDTQHSYLSVRADIIRAHAPDLKEEYVAQLARSTRGLVKPMIERCVDEFRRTGRIAYLPDHPTNTCCPHTGYWVERLTEASAYVRMLEQAGFRVRVSGGYYSDKSIVRRLVNRTIETLGRRSLFIAPYILFDAVFSTADISIGNPAAMLMKISDRDG